MFAKKVIHMKKRKIKFGRWELFRINLFNKNKSEDYGMIAESETPEISLPT